MTADVSLLVRDASGRSRAVVLTADDGARVAHAADALGARDLLVAGRPLDPALPLEAAGLVDGALVGVDTAALDAAPAPDGGLELAVVGGPAAGTAVPLRAGATVGVGRAPGSALRVDDPEVSRSHATVTATPEGVRLADAGSRNGVRWAGYRLQEEAVLAPGDAFAVGESVVALRRRAVGRQRVEPDSGPGRLRWNRPPRVRPPQAPPERTVPARPEPPHGRHLPLVVALLPAALGLVLYLVTDLPVWTLMFLALSPVLVLASAVSDRRSGRKQHRTDLAAYERARAALEVELAVLAREEERVRRDAAPDPAAVVDLALGPGARLWERRPADDDFLRLRLGLADAPSRTVLVPEARGGAPAALPEPRCRLVPVEVPLADVGVLGLAGPRVPLLRLARAVLTGATGLHAPRDLAVVVLTGRDDAADWEWATWLPHTEQLAAGEGPARLVATDGAQAAARVAELRRLVEQRGEESHALLRDREVRGRRVLLVLDGARRLRAVPGLPELLRDGPAAGVVAVCLDEDEGSLPDECAAVAVLQGRSGTRLALRLPDGPPVPDVLADGLSTALAERAARATAPLRALGGSDGGVADLPDRVRLLDLLGSTDLGADDVLASWARTGGRTTEALVGVGPDGPLTVDLRRDGPHALVAGTSGSGKSELLQTLVASLALGNTPEALSFVLVDYKGGAAFAACADLPHVTGMVTDLDGPLVDRALASLEAELKRRERVLAAAGAKDLDDHVARGGRDLPRLVLVVDEFASLAEEVPEFVQGVVGIGMRGRSLGVHVVLATQRPGGVVNAEIRANVNLRLCLRVTSDAESTDVVDSPEAGRLPRSLPGRAYLRTGHGELVPLQAARVGWPRPDSDATAVRPPQVVVRERRVTALGDVAVAAQGPVDGAVETDLSVVVQAVRDATVRAGASAVASPWLPPLPEQVDLAGLEAPLPSAASAVLGLADRPSAQAQPPFVLDLERTGCVAVGGTGRSGRSTVLRTLAAGLASGSSPRDLHLYALDCGGRALGPLEQLPHCGAVVDGDDGVRVGRLLGLLEGEVRRRQRVLAAGGHGTLAEQRAADPAHALPHVVLLLDRFEAFTARWAEHDGGRLAEQLEGLLRHGASASVTTVLTTDRSGFTYRTAGAVASRLVLRQADRDDAAAFGLDTRAVPTAPPPGRGVWVETGEQVQVAVVGDDASGAAQTAVLRALGARLAGTWADLPRDVLPRRVEPLPEEITLAEAAARRRAPAPSTPGACVPAVGGDDAAPVDVDLLEHGGFLVSGPPRSGRSTALAALVHSLEGRLPVVVVAPRPGPARDLAGAPGVVEVLASDDGSALRDLLDDLPGPLCVVVDDAELLTDGSTAPVLEELARSGRDEGRVVVAAGSTEDLQVARYRGWLAAVRRSRSGLLLAPSSTADGEVFDVRLPRGAGGAGLPGRGLLVLRGETQPAQVCLP